MDSSTRPFRAVDGSMATPWVNAARPIESGVCMAEVLRSETDRHDWLGTSVFVFDDPMAAIKMQCRYLKDHLRPLPIVGAFAGKLPTTQRGYARQVAPVGIWRWQNRDFVFWGPKYTPALMNMAARAYGQVKVFVGQPPGSSRVTLPAAWLALVRRHAKSWERALEDAVLTMPDRELGQLIAGLQIHDSRLRDALDEMSPEAKSKARCHPRCADVLRTAYLAPSPITEGPGGWYHKPSGKRISDAILRIERILCRDGDSKRYYEGHIVFRNAKVNFLASVSEIERGPFAWMRKHLLANGHGEMKSVGYWSGCAVEVAKQFHTPDVVINAGRIGWNGREGKFVLPGFSIAPGGKIIEQRMPTWDRLAPATNLYPPGNLDPRILQELTADTITTRVFWASVAAITANIIANARGYSVAGVALVGEGAIAIGTLTAKVLGCREYVTELPRCAPIDFADSIQKVVDRHNWPLHVSFPERTPPTHFRWWLACSDDKIVVVDLDPLPADAAGMFGRWRSIIFDSPAGEVDAIAEFGPHVLPHWLRDLCSRRLRPESYKRPLATQVLEDLAYWAGRNGGNSHVFRDAAAFLDDMLEDSLDPRRRLVRLLERFVASGDLAAEHTDFPEMRPNKTDGTLDREGQPLGIFMREDELVEVFRSKGLPPPDSCCIVPSGRPDLPVNVLRIEHEGQRGWIIEEEFWEKETGRVRKAGKRRRRIAKSLLRSRELAPLA